MYKYRSIINLIQIVVGFSISHIEYISITQVLH